MTQLNNKKRKPAACKASAHPKVIGRFVSLCLLSGLFGSVPGVSTAQASDYPPPKYVERDDRSPRDFVDFVERFGNDLWAVVRSPGNLDREGWETVARAGIVWGVLLYNDEDIQEYARGHRDRGVTRALDESGEALEKLGLMGETGRYYAAGIALGYALKWERLERISTDILFSHFVGGLIRQGAIRVVGRARPNEEQGVYEFEAGKTSMPSGHASTIFQLATVLSHHFPAWWAQTLFYGAASCVVAQRVTSDQHWASDSFLGAVYGYGVARVIVGTNDRRGYLVTPVVDPETGTGGVALQIRF